MSSIVRINRLRSFASKALLLASLLSLASCKLWTIRPIESKEQKPAVSSREFNADAYVDSIWQSKVVPLMSEQAIDLAVLLASFDADLEAARKQYGRGEPGST